MQAGVGEGEQECYTTYHPNTTDFPADFPLDYTQATIERGRNGTVVLTFPKPSARPR